MSEIVETINGISEGRLYFLGAVFLFAVLIVMAGAIEIAQIFAKKKKQDV